MRTIFNPNDRTYQWPFVKKVRSISGFTLLEILIVLGIISLIMSIGLPAIERVTYQRVNSTTRKFIGVIRTIRNDSILLNRIYRLAFNLDDQTWWVENQREFKLLGEEPRKKKNQAEAPVSNFAFAEKYSSKPTPMPKGVQLEGVLKDREGLMSEGLVYIHFFPNGFNERAILYINKEGSSGSGYSLLLKATMGQVDLYRERISQFEVDE